MLYGIVRASDALQDVRVSTGPVSGLCGDDTDSGATASPVLTLAISLVADAMVVDVPAEPVRQPTRAMAIAATSARPARRLPPTPSTLGVSIKEARSVVLTPPVGPDHSGEPEQRPRARDQRGADDGPLAAPGHERPR